MRLLLLAICLAAATPAHAQDAGHARMIGGDWTGVGYQVGPNGPRMSWSIALAVRADITSRIDYPSLGCKAVLHELKRRDDEIEFREEITEGNCIDGGAITARYRDGRVFWFWSKPNAGADASAVLYRDQPIG
jgi:hypothetical protein